jgi:hypothetical protein
MAASNMLNQKFNSPPPKPVGPRQAGQTVTNPRALAAIAIKNSLANNQALQPQISPLAQAINKRKKKY